MPENLAAALVAFQAAMPKLTKSATADTGKYKYKYAPLDTINDAVQPLLAANGLAWSCGPGLAEGHFGLFWRLMHTSGETLEGFMPLPANVPAQQLGGTITYYRRYAMTAVLNIAADEDDDGRRAQDSWESARTSARVSPGTRGGSRSRGDASTVASGQEDATVPLRTEQQSRRMFQLLNAGGVKDRDQVLAFITELVGRPVESTKELTREEAGLVIASLEAAAAEKAGHDEQP